MQLLDEEYFALTFALGEELVFQLDSAEVLERNRTGVGFFTTVQLNQPFSKINKEKRYWERNFEHKKLPYGGCFMVSLVTSNQLEIEAVAFEGSWPEPYERDEFIG
ncbi:hypothetical protein RI049_10700 [Cedecea neteri]|uniref:hypothetical protein n=1 Tax=Cedecea neteri TaxID=158822 RepID=UPI0005D9FB11|nr:hypothetical protein [Cedecea neteri]AJZ89765.1 hypothetical protein VW41_12325 [Klebsiella michiganensis]WPU25171.1 hypothetical protein RI049_10700 [Cedecea neteri]